MIESTTLPLVRHYPKFLLFFILSGSVLLSFTPYWTDITTLYDNKRFFIVFYLLLTASLLLGSHYLREQIITTIFTLSKTSKVLISITLTFSLIANFSSLYWVKSQAVITYALMLFLVTSLLVSVVLKYKNVILRFYIWLTLTLFLSVFLFHLIATLKDLTPNYRYIFSFVNPRNINHIQVWIILPLLYWAWTKKGSSKSWLCAIPVVVHFSLLFALDARGAFIASLGGIALWIALSERKVEKIKWVLLLISCGLAVKWLLFTPLPQLFIQGVLPQGQGEIRLSDSSRLNLWSNAIAMVSFFGNGGDTFVCNNDDIANTPHNSLLLIAVEWGVISAICYIGLLLHAFYRVCKTTDQTLRIVGIAMLSGFAYSFISGPLNTPISQGIAVVTIAMYWSTVTTSEQLTRSSAPYVISPKAATLSHIGLILIALWTLIFVGYKAYDRIENNQYRHIKLDYYKPQFWIEHNCIDEVPMLYP